VSGHKLFEQSSYLVSKSLAGGVAELIEAGSTSGLQHSWRTTHENYGIIVGRWKMVTDHFCINVADTLLPTCEKKTQALHVTEDFN